MDRNWKIRAVQLDLARQMETLDYIRAFTDLIAANGYNTLTLYLEGRVRTPSFPWLPEKESYSLEDMAAIVTHAKSKGVEVMPVVGTLGHADQFLRSPELRRLAELRGGQKGRFYTALMVLCPSLEETYEFLGKYLSEVAAVFPSEWFHAGCDEAWEIGYCELCRPRAEGPEGQAGIFAQHLNRIHQIVSGKLGKRMVIWDDLFEMYPEALEVIPKDIVMCAWHYEFDANPPRGRFSNRRREDILARYDQLGFDYLVAPADYHLDNILSLTAYATTHAPLGGLLTTWEKAETLMPQTYPLIAFAGRLWDGMLNAPDLAWEQSLRNLFGSISPRLSNALKAAFAGRNHCPCAVKGLLVQPDDHAEASNTAQAAVLADCLDVLRPGVTTSEGLATIEQLQFQLERSRIHGLCSGGVRTLVDPPFQRQRPRRRRSQASRGRRRSGQAGRAPGRPMANLAGRPRAQPFLPGTAPFLRGAQGLRRKSPQPLAPQSRVLPPRAVFQPGLRHLRQIQRRRRLDPGGDRNLQALQFRQRLPHPSLPAGGRPRAGSLEGRDLGLRRVGLLMAGGRLSRGQARPSGHPFRERQGGQPGTSPGRRPEMVFRRRQKHRGLLP